MKLVDIDEELFRRVGQNPDMWSKDDSGPTSALFKDSKGVSVNQRKNRIEDDVISFEEELHSKYTGSGMKALVSVGNEVCTEKELHVIEDTLEDNDYHALILRSNEKIDLTSGQAKHLAKKCRIVKKYY